MAIIHSSFSLAKNINARPGILWAIWSDATAKKQWLASNDSPGWTTTSLAMDFRVGGRERAVWVADDPGQPWHGEHVNDCVYLDIKNGEHIVMAYTMTMNGAVHSAILATVEFRATEGGTELTYSEHLALYHEHYGIDDRRAGAERLMQSLANRATSG